MKLTTGMVQHLFNAWLLNRAYSGETVKKYLRETGIFCAWLSEEKNKTDIREAEKDDIISYCVFLSQTEKKKGSDKRFSEATRKGMVASLKVLFRFLSRNDYIITNPFDTLNLNITAITKLRKSIPEKEINLLLDSIDLDEPINIRDRTIFELMYGTGLRVSEVSNLNMTDVDLNSGRLLVRQGKGKKDRIVPLGKNVTNYLELYLKKSRDTFLAYVKENSMRNAFFLGFKGKRLTISGIETRLDKWFKEIKSELKNICPHMLRHSFATHVLDHGAGIKEVKEILGHTCIETTVGYTHFSVTSLKRILRLYHPRENELYIELGEIEKERYINILEENL